MSARFRTVESVSVSKRIRRHGIKIPDIYRQQWVSHRKRKTVKIFCNLENDPFHEEHKYIYSVSVTLLLEWLAWFCKGVISENGSDLFP